MGYPPNPPKVQTLRLWAKGSRKTNFEGKNWDESSKSDRVLCISAEPILTATRKYSLGFLRFEATRGAFT
jgi:hypothetical protein